MTEYVDLLIGDMVKCLIFFLDCRAVQQLAMTDKVELSYYFIYYMRGEILDSRLCGNDGREEFVNCEYD
jgi:hypothetical protein